MQNTHAVHTYIHVHLYKFYEKCFYPDHMTDACTLSVGELAITFRPLEWEVAVSVVCIGFSWRENFINSDLTCGSATLSVNNFKRGAVIAQSKLYFIISIVKVHSLKHNYVYRFIDYGTY